MKSLSKLFLAAVLFSAPLYADVQPYAANANADTAITGSNRTLHQGGIYLSILGDPLAVMGINGAYNILDFARVTGGVGWLGGDAITLGGGVKFMVPTWSITPIVGLNAVTVVGTTSATSRLTGGLGLFMNAGIDFTSREGLNLGAGVQIPVSRGSGVLPYINVGYFF